MKARIARVCTLVGLDAFIEHQPTRADVFVPGADLALEYQRWDTQFATRNLARSVVGARQTLWFFPQPSKGTSKKVETTRAKLFRERVFEHGGLFITPAHKDDPWKPQEPWNHPEDGAMNRTTRLYVSGSVVIYDAKHVALKYVGAYGFHHFISQVAKGERTLQNVDVRLKSGATEEKLVWVRHSDLEKVVEEREKRSRARTAAAAAAAMQLAIDAPAAQDVQVQQHGDRLPATPVDLNAAEAEVSVPAPVLPINMPPRSAVTVTAASKQSLWARLRRWLSVR